MHRTEFLSLACMWLLPHCHPFSSEIHPVTFYHESSRRFSNNIPPSFWPTYQTLQSYTERQSWKPAHVQAHKEGQLLSRCYRKQQLREQEWSRGWGGEKILHCRGMGLKENTAQAPDVETPCTHTSTHTNKCKHTQWHTYKNKQMGKGSGNEGHKPALGAPLGVFWLVARAHFLSLLAVPKMSKHKMSRRANETVCVFMSVNESEWDMLNVREKAV